MVRGIELNFSNVLIYTSILASHKEAASEDSEVEQINEDRHNSLWY